VQVRLLKKGRCVMKLASRRALTICAVVTLTSLVHIQPASAAPSVEQCTDHMQAPWVALYEHPNFQGESICILGTGFVNLYGIDWDSRVSSINIGAEGYATDGSVAPCPERCLYYHYGTQIADLRTVGWDDRFAFVVIRS